jgi:hypothetical protein
LKVSERAIAAGAVLSAELHLFTFFSEPQIVAVRNRVETRPNGDYTWFGTVSGDDYGRAIVSVVNGTLSALVTRMDGRRYMILPRGGSHVLYEFDESRFPSTGDVSPAPTEEKGPRVIRGIRRRITEAMPVDDFGIIRVVPWQAMPAPDVDYHVGIQRDDPSSIDILVTFTRRAAQTDFGIISEIQLAIDEANQSFLDSDIGTHLNLVTQPFEVDHLIETGDTAGDQDMVEADLTMQNLRDYYAADLVVVVTDTGTAGGWGGGSFAVVRRFALPMLVLAHEVGHMMGGMHEWYSEFGGTAEHGPTVEYPTNWEFQPDTHGYILVDSLVENRAVRTIMAESYACLRVGLACPRIGRWSNPEDTTQFDAPLGVWKGEPFPANDARQLRSAREGTANRRFSVCRFSPNC